MEKFYITPDITPYMGITVDKNTTFNFEGQGVMKDFTKAFQWFEKAANQNHPDALHFFSICYQHDVGV